MAEQTSAAHLPGGSVVVDDIKGVAFYAVAGPGEPDRWVHTVAERSDMTVDYALRHGAEVVRVGVEPQPAALAPNARQRLARHLYLGDVGSDQHNIDFWERASAQLRQRYERRADTILAAITGRSS